MAGLDPNDIRVVFSEVSEKAVNFNSLVIAAGYATFFALWTAIDGYGPERSHAFAGLCLLVSAAIFSTYHMANMWVMINAFRVLASRTQAVDARIAFSEAKAFRVDRQNRLFLKVWPIAAFAIVLPLGIGLATLFALLLVKLTA